MTQTRRTGRPSLQVNDAAAEYDRVEAVVRTVTTRTDSAKSLWTTVVGTLWQAVWALLGFGLAAVLCFAVPVVQTAVQEWVRHTGRTTVGSASVMAGISMVWSALRAVTYALLLIAVFAGRSTSPPGSTPY